MAEVSVDVLNGITEFVVTELGAKVLDGISYILVPKKDRYKSTIERYDNLRRLMNKEEIPAGDIFRRYEVDNGIIYELDLVEAIKTTELISKQVADSNGGETPEGDLGIRESAYERHRRDMQRLCDLVVKAAKKDVGKIEVALFSKNLQDSIIITGNDAADSKRRVAVKYNAFALRHTDIEELNREYLSMYNLMISKVSVCELLPTVTGVRFILSIARVSD